MEGKGQCKQVRKKERRRLDINNPTATLDCLEGDTLYVNFFTGVCCFNSSEMDDEDSDLDWGSIKDQILCPLSFEYRNLH